MSFSVVENPANFNLSIARPLQCTSKHCRNLQMNSFNMSLINQPNNIENINTARKKLKEYIMKYIPYRMIIDTLQAIKSPLLKSNDTCYNVSQVLEQVASNSGCKSKIVDSILMEDKYRNVRIALKKQYNENKFLQYKQQAVKRLSMIDSVNSLNRTKLGKTLKEVGGTTAMLLIGLFFAYQMRLQTNSNAEYNEYMKTLQSTFNQ